MRWSEDNLKRAVNESYCIAQVCKNLGITATASNYRTYYKYIKKYDDIDTSHFTAKQQQTRGLKRTRRLSNEEVFVKNSTYPQAPLRKRVIKQGLVKYSCSCCPIETEYNGMSITLQLDHINGDNTDNRIENLRFLCPNCHSQTDTYMNKRGKIY